MATLLNKDGSVVPPRPDAGDSKVEAVIIHNAVECVFAERYCDFKVNIGMKGVMNFN
jgi:hypothetical protein